MNHESISKFPTSDCLPGEGLFVGRAWVPESLAHKNIAGPHVVCVEGVEVFDLSEDFLTVTEILTAEDAAATVRQAKRRKICGVQDLLKNSLFPNVGASLAGDGAECDQPVLLSPNDIQAIKACGVTFVRSLFERVIEERAGGDKAKALELRELITKTIGGSLREIKPGSEKAMALKAKLQSEGIWSQYLEVGIGKDAEVFTKAQPTAAVGFGARVGILADSVWNNPEPEVVLAVSPSGKIQGAALGNDVNLRDYEGRSALLLGEAKDQNGSCSIGPMIRLFDESFTLEQIEAADISLKIEGEDGFQLEDCNRMSEISRPPQALVDQACGVNHQYPDGFMLFLGTMFAPTEDRDGPGEGFTHHVGDRVEISTPLLGSLVNWVDHCDKLPKWEFGLQAYLDFARRR